MLRTKGLALLHRRAFLPERSGRHADLLAIGLGNPGSEFESSRHNVGADAIGLLATRHDAVLRAERGVSGRAVEVTIGGKRLALAVPSTYMNESGTAVRALLRRYVNGDLSRLVVIHDELDLAPGVVRVKFGGGTAGHNGLRSIQSHLKNLEFARVRIGIGKPPGAMHGADYVLRRAPVNEKAALESALRIAAEAVELILERGIDVAMNDVNAR